LPKNENITQEGHLYKLDVLRGVAIILVFGIHMVLHTTNGQHEITQQDSFGFIDTTGKSLKEILITFSPFNFGWIGVQLFFLISGFLIHYSFLRSKQQQLNLLKFYNRRFWRIYPPYLLVLLFLAWYQKPMQVDANLLSHLFMYYNYHEAWFFSYNPAFWSLALEIQLYLLYPVLLLLLKKLPFTSILILLFILAFCQNILVHFLLPHQAVYETFIVKNWFIWCLGAYWGHRFFHCKRIVNISDIWLVVAGLLFWGYRAWPGVLSIQNDLLGVAFLVLLGDWYLHQAGNNKNFLEKILLVVGLCSYSIYLWHQVLIEPLLNQIQNILSYNNALATHIYAMLVFILVFFAAYLYYYFVEKHSIKIGKWVETNFLNKY
jgi:peptidoglycan/LPS O-acetylase OafA/YrhL